MQNDKSKFKIGFGVVAAAVIVVVAWIVLVRPFRDGPALEEFAQCLRERGVTMYGADWCPHCQDQKAMFGSAFARVPYVECPDEPKLCQSKGIQSYPTWILSDPPATTLSVEARQGGRKLEGVQKVETLARESGCTFPAGTTEK